MVEQTATVYTETIVYSPPAAFVDDVPYQLAIIQFDDGRKTTVRILGERASIGDRVILAETRDNVQYYRLTQEQ